MHVIQFIEDNAAAILASFLATVFFEVLVLILVVWWKGGIKDTWNAIRFYRGIILDFWRSGIVSVVCTRKDYDTRQYGHISDFIKQANQDVLISSLSLVTGIQHEGIQPAIQHLLRRGVNVTILLLNPQYVHGIETITRSFSESKIREDIVLSLLSLHRFRAGLASNEARRLSLRVYEAIPFASAILIDAQCENSEGVIRIETKPYKAPMGESWGIDVKGKNSPLYKTFRQSWLTLPRRFLDNETKGQGITLQRAA